jgi:hypothetical protein
MALRLNDFDGGKSITPCHFRAQIGLDFQGPPLPMARKMDLSPSKSLPYRMSRAILTTGTLIVKTQR